MIVGDSPAAKRAPLTTDWSHSCGTVVKEGRHVPPRARKTFTAELLIKTEADWEMLRTEVQSAAAARPDHTERLTECVPMLMRYKQQFEQRARDSFGECVFFTATKARAWTFAKPNTIGRYVPGHGYFVRVLSKLVRYVLSAHNEETLSWKGFKEWLRVPAPGRKPEYHFPPGTSLARTGKCYVSVAVVCYVPPCSNALVREGVKLAIASECELLSDRGASNSALASGEGQGSEIDSVVEISPAFDDGDYDGDDNDDNGNSGDNNNGDNEEGEDQDDQDDQDDNGNNGDNGDNGDNGEDSLSTELRTYVPRSQAAAARLAPSDDEETPQDSDNEELPTAINTSTLAQKILKEKAVVQAEERRIAVRKSNIALWEDQVKEHAETTNRRKRAREEEIEGMLGETLVDRNGCEVDTSQEQRRVVAAYVKDVAEYADPNAALTEHFTSAKRHERAFTHERGIQHLRGEGYGMGVSRFVRAQVRHDYLAHSDEHKIVLVMEAKNEPTYFNVGVAQMQLKRAAVSMQEFQNHTKFYHVAYATAPPWEDIKEHRKLGHSVYSPDMTVVEKGRFFESLKLALAAARA